MIPAIASTLILLAGIAAYAPWRMGRLLALRRTRYLYLVSLFGLIGGYASISMVSSFTSVWVDRFYLFATSFLGFLFYVFVFLVVFELIYLFVKLPRRTAAIGVVAVSALVSGYGIWNAYRFDVRAVDVTVEGLEAPVNIAVVADIQMGGHRGKSYLDRVVEATNALRPDLVVIPGDLADSNAILTEDNFLPLADLQAPAFFITGNHDKYVDTNSLLRIIENFGVRVLQNEIVHTHGLQLVGLDYMNADEEAFDLHPSDDKQTIKSVLPTLGIDGARPAVLMHHSPVGATYVADAGVDLYIAGHTHAGGQVFPATLIGCRFFFPYCNGLYSLGDTTIFVSPGVGTFVLPMRIGTDNELTLLRLQAP